MGLMRFVFSSADAERFGEETIRAAYLSGIDRTAWQVQPSLSGNQLVMKRAVSDSARLHIPWQVEGHGRVVLSTGALREDFGPYLLPLELARGTGGQLREQLSEWQMMGLIVPESIITKVSEATTHFAQAALLQADPPASAARAEQALRFALDAADGLVATYVDQAMVVRRRSGPKLPTLLAGDLGGSQPDDYTAEGFLSAFNAAAVPICWRVVEASEGSHDWTACDQKLQWCRDRHLKVCAGPLLQLDPRSLPDWLYLWEDDPDSLTSFVCQFVTAAVERYRGKVHSWQCAARTNSADVLSISEEDKLRLTARSIELVRSLDPDTPAVVSFDQPWAEYMSRREVDFPPLHAAEALIQAGLNPSGLMLEVNLGYHPGGTLPRTALEMSRQLDTWARLGLPLWVSIAVPSAADEDPQAVRRVDLSQSAWTPEAQRAWVARFVPLILVKPYVQGIVWNQLRDAEPHDFPHGGLFDQRRQAKPALRTLAAIRRAYLS